MMQRYLKKRDYDVIVKKEYIIAAGELPVCLVAHLDTVSETQPADDIFYDQEQHVMWSPSLLGADDRAGVYAIIQIIEAGYKPSVIFTTDEEKGCLGADALVKNFPSLSSIKLHGAFAPVTQKQNQSLENLKAIFQIDRRGADDCVFYNCDNPEFEKYVESFGFKTAVGSFSDISILAPAWGVAAANLSCGYYAEHSQLEHLFCDELEKTIERVKKILDSCESMPKFEYKEKECINIFSNFFDFESNQCAFCGEPLEKGKTVTIKEGNGQYKICSTCFDLCYSNEINNPL